MQRFHIVKIVHDCRVRHANVFVGLEVAAISDDGSIYQFVHKFYLPDGTHCATAEATGVWIDIMLRKITTPPEDIILVMDEFKSENVKVITREFLKTLPFRPENASPELFK